MGDELKPCPFCGGPAKLWPTKVPGQSGGFVFCDQCGAEGSVGIDTAAAIAAWNTRAQGPGPGEAVAWRPMTPDMDHVGPALCAVRVYTCGKFRGWDIHYVVIDDETREIAPDFEQGWAISDYEFWMPIAPPSMIAATPTREA